MAKSKKTPASGYAFTDIPLSKPWETPVARFWRELEKDKSAEGDKLRGAVRAVVEGAAALSGQVARDMPLYTDHGERHLRNVLHIMESLVTDAGIEDLRPIGCALCIIVAYVHDLGMVLSEEERAELAVVRAKQEPTTDFGHGYRSHEDAQPALVRERDRLRRAGQVSAADLIDAHLLAEFLRRRHATSGAIARELTRILEKSGHAVGVFYAKRDWREAAVAIAASHGERAHWLRETHFGGREDRVWEKCPGMKKANLVLPGLLLRLADIIDLDRSRTPEILFYHLGLGELGEPELARLSGREISASEWQKHLAVDEYGFVPRGSEYVVRYVSYACPHPAVEHSIREFIRWIDEECDAVARELRQMHRGEAKRVPLSDAVLPLVRADLDLTPAKAKGVPVYTYDPEFRFRLDQDQVMRLLMGANLYGDPAICIRELLQNSLDALELRQARLKRREHDKAVGEPVDELAKGENLRVDLSWGEDEHGRRFIRVRDWGTGMTRDQIRRFFATVGKSYYQSPEFHAEQAALKRDGAGRVSPISQFGIGILSCFMVAERMTVHTHPGGTGKGREPSRFEVTGPGKLFVLREEGLETQGTEITLWLREHIKFEPWTAAQAQARVRKELGYSLTDEERELAADDVDSAKQRQTMADLEGRVERSLHPGFEAMRHLIWPLFPIGLRGRAVEESWEIDPGISLHFDVFGSIDPLALKTEARRWLYCGPLPSAPSWTKWDWTDPDTGSRVRLVYPTCGDVMRDGLDGLREETGAVCSLSLLAAWCNRLLCRRRMRYLARGIEVADVSQLELDFVLGPGLGVFLWVDLRGNLAPGVTTARDRALPPADLQAWSESMRAFGTRYLNALENVLANNPSIAASVSARLAVTWDRRLNGLSRAKRGENAVLPCISILALIGLDGASARGKRALQSARWLNREALRDSGSPRARDRSLPRPIASSNVPNVAHVRGRAFSFASKLANTGAFRRAALNLVLDRALVRLRSLEFPSNSTMSAWRLRGAATWLNEALFPSLAEGFPPLAIWDEVGQAQERWLQGPTMLLRGGPGEPPRHVRLSDVDFFFPLSVAPLSTLRAKIAEADSLLGKRWREWHSVLVLPFLLPDRELVQNWSEILRHAAALKGVGRLSAFWPRLGLWETPFSEWKADEYPNAGYTAVWDLAAGTVKWRLGLVAVTDVKELGLEFPEFLKSPEVKAYHEWLRTLPEEQEAECDLAEWRKRNGESDDFL